MSASDHDSRPPHEPVPPELARPLAALVEERRRGLTDHPEPRQVLAYGHGELSPAETEEMREHLCICGDCLDLLLLQPDVGGGAAGDERGALDFETFRAWREMRARIREHDLRLKLARRTRALRWLQAAAAVLLLAPGLVWMTARKDASLGNAPVVNSAIFDVKQSEIRGLDPLPDPAARPAPHESVTRNESVTRITVPENIDSFTLVFWLDAPEFDAYEIFVRDRDGDEIWRSRDLEVELGTATLGLSRRFMKPGRYHVEIYGIEDDGREQDDGRQRVGDYAIELDYS